ncbi:Protein kinase, partial [Aphelenchoides avenae]
MSLAKVPTLFKCVKCGKEYNKRSSWQSHMETHGDKLHECDQCEKKFKSRAALRYHKLTSHVTVGQFECDECGKLYPHKTSLSNHKRDIHAEEPCECVVCGTSFRNPSKLAQHKLRMHPKAEHQCEYCGKIFGWAGDLRRHVTLHNAHPKAKHRCEHCGKIFERASVLRKHVVTHDEKREEYRCDQCPRTFKSRKGRETHVKTEHSDSRFTCDSECGLHSATRSEYRDHLKSRHAELHPATCKCVSIDVVLSSQVAKSLGNTAFVEANGMIKCTDGGCNFETTCARHMESHKEQRHHDAYKPVLRCSSCKTWFSTPGNLKGHDADKHQGERRFRCDRCGYVTNYNFAFTKHQTSCQQGKAHGNFRLKKAEPTTKNLDVKKESPRDVYQFGPMIGEGGFGTVYKAVKKGQDPSVKYAIKEVGPNGGKSAELEAEFMRQFEHKNLMTLLEYYECEAKGRLTRFIVMEYCRPGSLIDMQKLVKFQFEEPHVLYVLKEVACGLEHLHSAGVIHRDLKSANVLVNERAEVKISDFGVSTDERIA